MEAPAKTDARERKGTAPKPLPAPNSDFYELADTLNAEERALLKQVRAFMETKVAPIINKYWIEDAFPFELLPAIKELNLGGVGMQGYGCRGGSVLLFGLAAMEMSRVDSSIATFFGVHNGLAMGSIYAARIGGAKAEVAAADGSLREDRLLRPDRAAGGFRGIRRPDDDGETRGRYLGLERPEEVDRQLALVRRLDHLGRDVADNQVKGFIVENKTTPGFSVEKIQNKIALKVVQNGLITLKDVPGARGEPPSGRQVVPRHRAGAADDAVSGRRGRRRDARWAPTSTRSSTPRSVCSSASRSARSSSSRTCSPG